jgi:hypothetical protein
MPKKTESGPIPEQSVKLAGDVVQMARTVVAARGGAMSTLISDICRPLLQKTIKEMQDRGEFLPKPPSGER